MSHSVKASPVAWLAGLEWFGVGMDEAYKGTSSYEQGLVQQAILGHLRVAQHFSHMKRVIPAASSRIATS